MDKSLFIASFEKAQEEFLNLSEADQDRVSHAFEAVKSALIVGFDSNRADAKNVLEQLDAEQDRLLFSEVGKLTRHLHSTLEDFKVQLNPKLGALAEHGVPQAADQLESVIRITDDAAHKVLGLVETQATKIDNLLENSETVDLSEIKKGLKEISDLNTQILMAQEFQDISGQIIRKVITLIADVEDSLVHLVKMFGLPPAPAVEKPQEELVGPDLEKGCDQSDVNELLSSLGF